MNTLEISTEADYLTNAEVEEMNAANADAGFHAGYAADMAAFEGMGR